jgi:hypothetical protein
MTNKLIDYCKEHHVNEEEGIKIIHTFLNRKGYTRTKWKKVRFGLYAEARIQHNGDTTIGLVTEIVQTPEYQKSFESFYPYEKLDKVKETINLYKLISDKRQYPSLQRVFKEKGLELINFQRFVPKHLRETIRI